MMRWMMIGLLSLWISGCTATTTVPVRLPILKCLDGPPPTRVKANAAGHRLIRQLRAANDANLRECEAYNEYALQQNRRYGYSDKNQGER